MTKSVSIQTLKNAVELKRQPEMFGEANTGGFLGEEGGDQI